MAISKNLTPSEHAWHSLMHANIYTRGFHASMLVINAAALLFVLKVKKIIGA